MDTFSKNKDAIQCFYNCSKVCVMSCFVILTVFKQLELGGCLDRVTCKFKEA